jgi:hypothetical protein
MWKALVLSTFLFSVLPGLCSHLLDFPQGNETMFSTLVLGSSHESKRLAVVRARNRLTFELLSV